MEPVLVGHNSLGSGEVPTISGILYISFSSWNVRLESQIGGQHWSLFG